jgi:hypothetical protein
MKEAIQKAIEEGYVDEYGESVNKLPYGAILLSPNFWQALGKGCGWKEYWAGNSGITTWLENWHRFIDHLAQGGTPDEFFNELLK